MLDPNAPTVDEWIKTNDKDAFATTKRIMYADFLHSDIHLLTRAKPYRGPLCRRIIRLRPVWRSTLPPLPFRIDHCQRPHRERRRPAP